MKITSYVPILFGILLVPSLIAQVTWSANAATAVPNFQANGIVKTQTVDTTAHGRGVRPRMTQEGFGTSFLYLPVTAPNANTFGCIGLRAMDNTTAGFVRAEFWRQPRNGNAGPAVLLGAVSTADVLAPADGFQFQMAPFAAVAINYNLFTYYVRLVMTHSGGATAAVPSVIGLDASLSGYCVN